MGRGVSIHIGVNEPGNKRGQALSLSEIIATNMASLAYRAGYRSIHLLCGAQATRAAVLRLIRRSARTLSAGDTLFVSYAGHGAQVKNLLRLDGGYDETLCLADCDLVDDDLLACWRLAPEDARILLVFESCHGGGAARDADLLLPFCGWADPYADWTGEALVYRSDEDFAWPDDSAMRGVKQMAPADSCIATDRATDDGIRASVLVMAAAGENELAREGLYTQCLLKQWQGNYEDTYCDLHRAVSAQVQQENPSQHPQIYMLGAPAPKFPLSPAFHLDGPPTRGQPGSADGDITTDQPGLDDWDDDRDWDAAGGWDDVGGWDSFR